MNVLDICDCKGWKEGVKQIDRAIGLMRVHGGDYIGEPFRYCPWCGKKLKSQKPKIIEPAHPQYKNG